MTTHKNTHEQQYRHAPLNGLAIGTIVGAVWALAIFGYQVSSILAGADSKLSSPRLFMSFIFLQLGGSLGCGKRPQFPETM